MSGISKFLHILETLLLIKSNFVRWCYSEDCGFPSFMVCLLVYMLLLGIFTSNPKMRSPFLPKVNFSQVSPLQNDIYTPCIAVKFYMVVKQLL